MSAITLNNPILSVSSNPTSYILPYRLTKYTFADSQFYNLPTERGIRNVAAQDVLKIDDTTNTLELGINGSSANILIDENSELVQIGNLNTPADDPAIIVDGGNNRIEIKGSDTIMNPSFSPNPSSFYLKFWSTDQNQYFYIHLERQ